MNELKVFKVEEANATLPKIVGLIEKLQKLRSELLSLEVEIDAVELVSEKDDSGASAPVSQRIEKYNKAVARFYETVDEVHSVGCFLKDVDLGLIDFYGLHEGRVVYFCWKLGEPAVTHWHEVGQGYMTRQPIPPNPPKSKKSS